MHRYRTHNCNALCKTHIEVHVKLSGWVHRRRDHGGVVFIDLRDHYGITQLVFLANNAELRDSASRLHYESVITVTGKVVGRSADTVNQTMNTGEIEVVVESYIIESDAAPLPIQVNSDQDTAEDTRLRYRFLDLRREKIHKNILLRSKIIAELRRLMHSAGFVEFQTPILTASSPEGARDFVVPSRLHPGKFYALPQAPQQFKQLLMMSGFDKYFQIAPCFRDEDLRAERSLEFYQLDVEMSFVTQEDIFRVIEQVLHSLFVKFSDKRVSAAPFARISYDEAMAKYGTDKPDLRNPIILSDVTEIFLNSGFIVFAESIKKGAMVKAIPAPNASVKPRKFFDDMVNFALEHGAQGLGYIQFADDGNAKGPVAKFLSDAQLALLKEQLKLNNGDAVFFSCAKPKEVNKIAAIVRAKLGEVLELIDQECFEFCWITDFPFYALNDESGKIEFNHNPFSMPQGGIDAIGNAKTQEQLLQIKAFQYDIVCNGVELSSGAIRNHKLDVMYKAFEVIGYDKIAVDSSFPNMVRAFQYGAPPHGGIAPGIDRIVMLISGAPNLREVIAFPMNQKGEDLLMCAPSYIPDASLQELNLSLSPSARANRELSRTRNKSD